MEARNRQPILVEMEEGTDDLEALRPRWVGWVLSQLERRGLLVQDAPRPGHWVSEDTIEVMEFTQWLSKHLNVSGWRAILQQTRQHNEIEMDEWDPSTPRDLLDAVELVLQSAYVPAPAPPIQEDDEPASQRAPAATPPVVRPQEALSQSPIVTQVEERDSALRNLAGMLMAEPQERDESHLPALAWLMAPRSAAAVVKAHATSAKAFAELKRARSEALLRALHNLENDTRSSAVLVQIQDLRQRLGSRLETYCAEHGIARPKPNTEEEASLLLLLNAQLIALDDAQDEIARRSAELSREKVRAAQETARANLEANVLPERLQNKVATNPVRERILCEDMRHHSATWVARLMGTLGGALTGFMTATTDVLVSSIAETAAVTGPPLVVLLLTLVTQTVAHHGPLTFGIVSGFLGAALWNALLILGITLTGYAVWRFLDKRARNLREHRVREGAARGYAARGYAARSQAAQPGASPYDPRWASGDADVGAPAQAQRPKTRSVRDYAIDALGLDARP